MLASKSGQSGGEEEGHSEPEAKKACVKIEPEWGTTVWVLQGSCVRMHTHFHSFHSCLLVFTHVYSCLLMFTDVFSCFLMFTRFHSFSLVFTHDSFSLVFAFTHFHSFSLIFTHFHSFSLIFTKFHYVAHLRLLIEPHGIDTRKRKKSMSLLLVFWRDQLDGSQAQWPFRKKKKYV